MEHADAEPAGSAAALESFCHHLVGIPFIGCDHVLLAYRSYFP